MKSAIIGTGLIAGIHAQALTSLGHTISVVINPHQEKAQQFAGLWHAERSSAVLEDAFSKDVDCVHVCTPPLQHADIIRQLLAAGKHVICEKPLCFNSQEAEELYRSAYEKKLVNAVVFNSRCYGAVQTMKQMIDEEQLGRIVLIHGSYQQEYHALPDVYSWRYQPEKAGKMRAVTEIGSHWIDLASYLSGLSIDAVSAAFGGFSPERIVEDGMMYAPDAGRNGERIHVASEDAASITMKYSNGALGSLLLSEVSHGRGNLLSIEIVGTEKSLWWNSEDPGVFSIGEKGKGIEIHRNAFQGGYPETFATLFRNIYTDIEAGQPSVHPDYPTFLDGAVNTKVCNAVYDSAEQESKWIKVHA